MSVKEKLISVYRKANTKRTFLLKEFKSPLSIKLKKQLKFNKDGFLSESSIIYNLADKNKKSYLSDYQRLRTRYINESYSFILDDKIVFENMYKDTLSVPETISMIEKGRILSLSKYNVDSTESLIGYLKEKKKCVIKPMRNGGGFGIHILELIDTELHINSNRMSDNELKDWLKTLNKYFISEYIEQGSFSNNLYKKSINTIRLITVIKPETNDAYIPIAVQRIGNNSTAPTDNWTQGGYSAEINLESGELGKAVRYPKNNSIKRHSTHPETNKEIEGQIIPRWNEIKTDIIKAAERFPYIKYVGWDIVITEDGYSVIEGNNFTDVNLLQVHKPLLEDEILVEFYKYYNII